ncbi:MAG: 4Fe-4S dicluster domain-containing protein [Planctomycetota bacterium]|jgi:NADH:ubiquinone oxidoreductase subunit F (NADH-binding)/(2Fe-2S) ferredoxin/Pyruvate/2-oxoacid:ferredoxin oxidoreductase delta subunit|nr:4Fe-4S dicluster domain-containing protein [Planctomycetota bacterium]
MKKLTQETLKQLADEKRADANHQALPKYVLVCGGTGCHANTGKEIYDELQKEVEKQGAAGKVKVIMTGCFGFCEQGPIVKVLPHEAFYVHVKVSDAAEIIREDIVGGRVIERLLYKEPGQAVAGKIDDMKFYKKQRRVVLRNCGFIAPEDIAEYIGRDGYAAIAKVIATMKPDDVIEEMKKSGLRGRGGAGFPTWMKWNFCKMQIADQKYMVCNADEGDPGAYMDRSTIEGDPHAVLEGLMIAGFAIGANKGFIYIRAEYPLAIERLEIAMQQAREYGVLGDDILGTGFNFDIEIRLGAGAFVCGEETALLASIEGERGMPRPRPPFPAIKGLWGKPTCVNNVESLASIPYILLNGGEEFAKVGTEKSKGTKVFALTGKIANSGLVEVPMGTTLREIIFDIGGGCKHGKKFKAVQTGGPSGGVLTEAHLDTPIDYDNLIAVGSMMGSGGMIVMDEDDCIVDIVRFYLDFSVDESCGKCAPCRIGGRKLLNILNKIAEGKGEDADVEQIKTIADAMRKASLCALGQTTPNPALSIIRYFNDELLVHIRDKKCPAGKCKKLLSFAIDKTKCIGCGLCAKKCPAGCIAPSSEPPAEGKKRSPYVISASDCLKCGECFSACKFKAVVKG